ncbi:MAG: AAA family ATPase [Treponema sp.]
MIIRKTGKQSSRGCPKAESLSAFSVWNDRYLYVDKTAYIAQLVVIGRLYFLSRPQRFH